MTDFLGAVELSDDDVAQLEQRNPHPMVKGIPMPDRPQDHARYDPAFASQVERLCLLLGANTGDIATFFGVTSGTITMWQKKYPMFGEAVQRGRLHADSRVAEMLYLQATGQAKVRRSKIVTDNKTSTHTIVEYDEALPASIPAAIYWLRQRQPAQWRESQHIPPPDISKMTDAELEALAAGESLTP